LVPQALIGKKMPHKILKSLLPTEEHVNSFQRLCNTQIEEMRKYDAHMVNVKKDPKTYHKYPAPVVHPDIMASIIAEGNDYNVSFEIVDDAPVPTLEEKKNNLYAKLNKIIFDAQEEILPTPKRKLLTLKATKAGAIKPEKLTVQQKADLIALQPYDEKQSALMEYHIQCENDIYDLTEKTVDVYKLPPIPQGK
jgi:hypothetical protein